MVEKRYEWLDGAELQEHSKRKHKILREYVFNYLAVRCKLPWQRRFRLAIVDGFAGGGRYQCGTAGSPIIFVEELKRASEEVNALRVGQGLEPVEIECLLVLNDANRDVINLLQRNVTPLRVGISQTNPSLHLRVEYLHDLFEDAYPKIKNLLARGRFRNVLLNLDQCGSSHVRRETICNMMQSYRGAEIFYTFAIKSLLTYLRKDQPKQLRKQLDHLGIASSNLQILSETKTNVTKNEWLGAAERIVFDTFQSCAPYVSPFSINNPDGWRYWLIHFSHVPRARQVYNDILHNNASFQAHFGRAGLYMLHYDPSHDENCLYLFDEEARSSATVQLFEDIPRLVEESGDVISVPNFYESIYNATPAHADDIHASIIENPDLEVITKTRGKRRKSNTISADDYIRLKKQRSFFPVFEKAEMKQKK